MIVIKYGGNALPSDDSADPVLEAIADAFLDGEQIVLVHGGGHRLIRHSTKRDLAKRRLLDIELRQLRFLRWFNQF